MTAPLIEHHVLEYPGGYTRSIGPALSRYFTGLRDGKIVGVRLGRRPGDGAADRVRPDDRRRARRVRRGRARRERSPRGRGSPSPGPGKHHLGKPFAFALVQPGRRRHRDGARGRRAAGRDLGRACGCSPAGGPSGSATSPTSTPGCRSPTARTPDPAPPNQAEGVSDEPVTGIVTPIRLDYEINAGQAAGKYLRGLAEGKILGARAEDSDQVYVPPRGSDPTSGAPTTIEVEVADTGTVTTFCVVNIPGLSDTRAGDPVRVRADPARRRQHAVVRPDPGRCPPTRCGWACGCTRSGPRS